MSENELQNIEDQWRAGVELSEAWFEFADPYAIRKFREAKTQQAIKAQRMLMVADLWALLNSGDLIAFGHRVSPEISNGPVPVPVHVFCERPPPEMGDSDVIEMSGWIYERVKICRASNGPFGPTPSNSMKRQSTRGGRTDTYPNSVRVIRSLYENSANRSLSAEKLHPVFKAKFERDFPRDQYHMATPAVRTLRNHLKRYRQELAETGRN